MRPLRQLEELGVLEEAETGARGQRRYVARELMATVAGETIEEYVRDHW